jgi:Cation efflux family
VALRRCTQSRLSEDDVGTRMIVAGALDPCRPVGVTAVMARDLLDAAAGVRELHGDVTVRRDAEDACGCRHSGDELQNEHEPADDAGQPRSHDRTNALHTRVLVQTRWYLTRRMARAEPPHVTTWSGELGAAGDARAALVRHALRLEYLTVGWNVLEGVVAVTAAVAAGSVALLGFGIDSFVETASAVVLIWRLALERRTARPPDIERIEQQALKLVGASLFLLAAYVAADAAATLWWRERPQPSTVGILVTSVSIGVMWWLAREKRRTAHALGSRALDADSFQTSACWYLSLVVLTGVALNGAFGWWWADPVAALGMAYLLVREGREAWRAERCCD